MVAHHREVAGADWPVRTAAEAWRRRRSQYASWLEGQDAWMLAAEDEQGELMGYVLLTIVPSGPTWDLGELGEVESLAVAPHARGRGVGGALLDACREILRERGVRHWTVSVVEANAGATRMYERAGFRPFYRQLLGDVGD